MGVASIRTFFIQRMKDLAPIHHGEVEQETKNNAATICSS